MTPTEPTTPAWVQPPWWNEAAKWIGNVIATVLFLILIVSEVLLAVVDIIPDGEVRATVQVAIAVCAAIALAATRIQAIFTRDRVYSFGTVSEAKNEALLNPHNLEGTKGVDEIPPGIVPTQPPEPPPA